MNPLDRFYTKSILSSSLFFTSLLCPLNYTLYSPIAFFHPPSNTINLWNFMSSFPLLHHLIRANTIPTTLLVHASNALHLHLRALHICTPLSSDYSLYATHTLFRYFIPYSFLLYYWPILLFIVCFHCCRNTSKQPIKTSVAILYLISIKSLLYSPSHLEALTSTIPFNHKGTPQIITVFTTTLQNLIR